MVIEELLIPQKRQQLKRTQPIKNPRVQLIRRILAIHKRPLSVILPKNHFDKLRQLLYYLKDRMKGYTLMSSDIIILASSPFLF